MANQFGIRAHNHHVDDPDVVKYMDRNERKDFLLHFVNGHVCMTDSSEGVDESIVYDTDYEANRAGGQNQLEHGGAPFIRVFTQPLADATASGRGEFDECNAMDFLNRRAFPGPNPHLMFINPPAV